MGKLPFPRLQVLRANGTWLPWIDDTEWCAPLGSSYADIEYVGGPGSKCVEVASQEDSDRLGKLGKLPPPFEDPALPIGTDVAVTRDDGSIWLTRTRTDPWQLGDGTWVVGLEGRAGGFRLDRVRRREEPTTEPEEN